MTWLDELKVGDEVMIAHSWELGPVRRVEKVTPKRIWVAGVGYWKRDGHKAGDYYARELRQLTPEVLVLLARVNKARTDLDCVENFVRGNPTDIQLSKVSELIRSFSQEPK